MATVAVLWPLNIPLAALAFKIRQGRMPVEMEPDEWSHGSRCTFAPLILAAITVAFFFVDNQLTQADFPAGPVHMVVFFGYLATASWLFYVFFALEDFFQALGMVVIYFYVPMTVLYLFDFVTGRFRTGHFFINGQRTAGWWSPLVDYALKEWLKQTG
jgi:hypothetical protein